MYGYVSADASSEVIVGVLDAEPGPAGESAGELLSVGPLGLEQHALDHRDPLIVDYHVFLVVYSSDRDVHVFRKDAGRHVERHAVVGAAHATAECAHALRDRQRDAGAGVRRAGIAHGAGAGGLAGDGVLVLILVAVGKGHASTPCARIADRCSSPSIYNMHLAPQNGNPF